MNKNPTTIKKLTAFKRQRNYCVSLRRKNNLSTTTLQKGALLRKNILNFQQAIP